jgi:hypothetical protein
MFIGERSALACDDAVPDQDFRVVRTLFGQSVRLLSERVHLFEQIGGIVDLKLYLLPGEREAQSLRIVAGSRGGLRDMAVRHEKQKTGAGERKQMFHG